MGSNANDAIRNAHLTTPTRLTGAEIVWATLVGEGVTDCLRLPGRSDSSGLRCAAQISHPSRPCAPRAGRRAHGRRLRARLGQSGRGHRHQRSRRDQPRHRNRNRHARFHSHRLHHRQCLQQSAGHRRVSGSRHYRHYAARDQAQFSRQQDRGHCSCDSLRLSDRAIRPARPRARRHHQGCATRHRDLRLCCGQAAAYRPHPMLRVEESGLQQAAELIRNSKAAGHPRWSRRRQNLARWSRSAPSPSAHKSPLRSRCSALAHSLRRILSTWA